MTKEEHKAYSQGVRDFRKKHGLCRNCGKVKPREGKTRCQSCAEKDSKRALKYYYRKKGETE